MYVLFIRKSDFMKCEYCGYTFNAPKCPNCGAFAPADKIEPSGNFTTDPKKITNDNYIQYYAGVKVRSILLCIVLCLITCGLYLLIWMSNLNDESNFLSREPKPTTGTPAVLYSIFTCGIYLLYWSYMQGERIDKARMIKNLPPTKMGIIYLVLILVPYIGGIVSFSLMQNEINKLAV